MSHQQQRELDLATYFWARPIGAVPDGIARPLVACAGHEVLDSLYTLAAATWTDFTEAWLTRETRDRALGLFGNHARFVAVEADHSTGTGPDLLKIGIGHGVGEPGFGRLARPLVRAQLQTLWQSPNRSQSIVIKRCRYSISVAKRQQITVIAVPEFGVPPDDDEVAETTAWLQKTFTEWLRTKPDGGR